MSHQFSVSPGTQSTGIIREPYKAPQPGAPGTADPRTRHFPPNGGSARRPRLSGRLSRRRLRGSCTPTGKHFQLLHPGRPKQSRTTPGVLQISPGKNSPPDTSLFWLFWGDFSPPRVTGPRNYPRLRASSPAEERRHLSLRSGTGAPPARHLSSWSQTPSGGSPLARGSRPCHPPPGAPSRRGTRRDPPPRTGPRRKRTRAGQRGVSPDASSGRPLRAPASPRLCSLTWPEAGPQGRCPARGPPQEGAAAAPGARRRRRLQRRLSWGFSEA